MDLAERYGVKKEQFPVLKLFLSGQDEPVLYEGEFKADDIKAFVKKHSGTRLWPGLLQTDPRVSCIPAHGVRAYFYCQKLRILFLRK